MGQFSWFAQDTKKQIFNDYERNPIHMVDPRDGTDYLEEHYEGYGVFGGRDFYELFADLNKDFIFKYELDFNIKNQSFDYYKIKYLKDIYLMYSRLSYEDFKKEFLKQYSKNTNSEKFDDVITKFAKEEYDNQIKEVDEITKIFSKNWKDLTEDELDTKRGIGIDLWYTYIEDGGSERKPIPKYEKIISPILVENYKYWDLYKNKHPKSDPNQGWHFSEDEYDDEDDV